MHYVQTTPGWEAANIKVIGLDYIAAESSFSQVRQDGTDPRHSEELSYSILTNGQKVPVTVEITGQRPDGTTIYESVDGNHRAAAIRRLRKFNPKDARWSTIKVRVESFKTDWDRLIYQTEQNNHESPVKVSCADDATICLLNIIINGMDGAPASITKLQGSQGRNVTEPGKYEKDLNKAVKLLFPALPAGKRKAVVRNLQGKRLPGKFGRWDAALVKDAFAIWADSAGVKFDYEVLHTLKAYNYIDWELIGRCFASKDDANYVEWTGDQEKNCEAQDIFFERNNNRWMPVEDAPESTVILYLRDVTGKNNKNIDEQRTKMIEKINKRNNSWLLRTLGSAVGRVALVDRIFIAPQKRDVGCKESGFYEVPKNSKGEFSTTLTARTGWDTEKPAPPIGIRQPDII